MKNKQKNNFYVGAFLLCCTVILLILACENKKFENSQTNEDTQTFITDLSSLSSGENSTLPHSEKIAKIVEQAISDRIRGRDMGIGTPELELVDSKNNIFTYKGTVPSYSSMFTINHEITVVYDGKTVVYSFDDNPDYKITIKPSQDNNKQDSFSPKNTKTVNNQDFKKGLETILLKIYDKDSPYYKIEFSDSTMSYLSRELQISGLEQTAYIPKNFYDVIVEYLLLFNNIFKEKRIFTEREISDIQDVFLYLDSQSQDLITETYSYKIDEDSFPDGKKHGLTTSIILVGIIYETSKFYWKSCITEKYEIDNVQNGKKRISSSIPKEESDFFMEVFPGIYREMLIKRFVYN